MDEISKPFAVEDFLKTISKIFESLIKCMDRSSPISKRIENEVNQFFENSSPNGELPIDILNALYIEVSRNVPQNKINKAKLDSIHHIISMIKKYSGSQPSSDELMILEFVRKSRYKYIFDFENEIQIIKAQLVNTENEKNFLISQIRSRLSKISRDLDDYITMSLNLNDPVELDKTDKRMIRSVLDITHISNGLNVDYKKKVTNAKNPQPK